MRSSSNFPTREESLTPEDKLRIDRRSNSLSRGRAFFAAAILFAGLITANMWPWLIPDMVFGSLHGALPNKLGIKHTITILQIVVLNAAALKSKLTQFVRSHKEDLMFAQISSIKSVMATQTSYQCYAQTKQVFHAATNSQC